jgi:carbon storage regulator CsrA
MIGTNVTVTIWRVRAGNQVVMGIDAPPGVAVDREELRERKIRDPRNAEKVFKTEEVK